MFPRAVWGFRLGGRGSVYDLGVQIGRWGLRLGGGGSDWAATAGSDWVVGVQIGSGEGSDWGVGVQIGAGGGVRLARGSDWAVRVQIGLRPRPNRNCYFCFLEVCIPCISKPRNTVISKHPPVKVSNFLKKCSVRTHVFVPTKNSEVQLWCL